jgi:hypothetical protein
VARKTDWMESKADAKRSFAALRGQQQQQPVSRKWVNPDVGQGPAALQG